MKYIPKVFRVGALFLFLGLILGTFSALSFLRTEWINFHPDFFFWVSMLMTLISLLVIGFSIWQYMAAEMERKKGDAQVKIWMQDANGIVDGLRTVAVNCLSIGAVTSTKYSTVNDVGMAVYSFASYAQALYQSLYEERCVTEEEYRAQQRELGEARHAQQLKKIREEPKVV